MTHRRMGVLLAFLGLAVAFAPLWKKLGWSPRLSPRGISGSLDPTPPPFLEASFNLKCKDDTCDLPLSVELYPWCQGIGDGDFILSDLAQKNDKKLLISLEAITHLNLPMGASPYRESYPLSISDLRGGKSLSLHFHPPSAPMPLGIFLCGISSANESCRGALVRDLSRLGVVSLEAKKGNRPPFDVMYYFQYVFLSPGNLYAFGNGYEARLDDTSLKNAALYFSKISGLPSEKDILDTYALRHARSVSLILRSLPLLTASASSQLRVLLPTFLGKCERK